MPYLKNIIWKQERNTLKCYMKKFAVDNHGNRENKGQNVELK